MVVAVSRRSNTEKHSEAWKRSRRKTTTNTGTMNLFGTRFTAAALLLSLVARVVAQPELDAEYMSIAEIAAELSLIVYFDDPENNIGFDTFETYSDGPDRAIVASKDGRCYASFRGTEFTEPLDIKQQLLPGLEEVCPSGSSSNCCQTGADYWDAYDTDYRSDLEDEIEACATSCVSLDDCVYLTGHSSGGSVARVAAVVLKVLEASVISFGNENTLNAGCSHAEDLEDGWVRWANTRETLLGLGLKYDKFPFSTSIQGLTTFGSTILLSDDTTAVANIGSGDSTALLPKDPFSLLTCHRIDTDDDANSLGYRNRIENLIAQANFPIPTTGFTDGSSCTQDFECESDQCSTFTKVCE